MASARLSAAGLGHSEYDLRPTAARTARCPDAYDTSQRMLQPSGMGLRGSEHGTPTTSACSSWWASTKEEVHSSPPASVTAIMKERSTTKCSAARAASSEIVSSCCNCALWLVRRGVLASRTIMYYSSGHSLFMSKAGVVTHTHE